MHPLTKFNFCPVCGSKHFEENDEKSKRCEHCGFTYYLNPSAATAAFILNDNNELLVTKRKYDPGKGTLDLPGGFCDIGETVEEGLRREIAEETGLEIADAEYFCSMPNKYRYSGFDVPTLDAFFICHVKDATKLRPSDDAEEARWIPLAEVHTELFGLRSIRHALLNFLEMKSKIIKK